MTRRAIGSENFTAAASWREYAYKQCEDRATLEGLDRDISAARAQIESRDRAAAERRQNTREVLKVFLGWVAANRTAADRSSSAPACDPPPAGTARPDESKDRFCTATRAAGTHQLLARYWAADPAAARFSVKLPDQTSCEEIGAARVLKTWSVPATQGRTTPRSRCEFVAGPLAGMHAVVSQAVNADLYVFNPTYLDRDPGFRPIFDGP